MEGMEISFEIKGEKVVNCGLKLSGRSLSNPDSATRLSVAHLNPVSVNWHGLSLFFLYLVSVCLATRSCRYFFGVMLNAKMISKKPDKILDM
jgi:hypothetical protein